MNRPVNLVAPCSCGVRGGAGRGRAGPGGGAAPGTGQSRAMTHSFREQGYPIIGTLMHLIDAYHGSVGAVAKAVAEAAAGYGAPLHRVVQAPALLLLLGPRPKVNNISPFLTPLRNSDSLNQGKHSVPVRMKSSAWHGGNFLSSGKDTNFSPFKDSLLEPRKFLSGTTNIIDI